MFVLVDYDNFNPIIKSKGPDSVVFKILQSLEIHGLLDKRIAFRLYGGWYEKA